MNQALRRSPLALAAALLLPAAQAAEWTALPDARLDQLRGGFSVGAGLMVSFGIMRSVTVNGVTTQAGFEIAHLGSITAAQAEQLARQATALNLTRVGPGNVFDAALVPGTPAIVIQNTLDNQHIQSSTRIDAVSNGMSLLKGMRLLDTLNQAPGAAAR
jgi:hypothetical protein